MRVKAVNVIGESDPLPLDRSFIAKNQADVPDPPGRPEAFDWDVNHIDLKWNKPLFDGGAPVQGYHVQKKQKGKLFVYILVGEVWVATCNENEKLLFFVFCFLFSIFCFSAKNGGQKAKNQFW